MLFAANTCFNVCKATQPSWNISSCIIIRKLGFRTCDDRQDIVMNFEADDSRNVNSTIDQLSKVIIVQKSWKADLTDWVHVKAFLPFLHKSVQFGNLFVKFGQQPAYWEYRSY